MIRSRLGNKRATRKNLRDQLLSTSSARGGDGILVMRGSRQVTTTTTRVGFLLGKQSIEGTRKKRRSLGSVVRASGNPSRRKAFAGDPSSVVTLSLSLATLLPSTEFLPLAFSCLPACAPCPPSPLISSAAVFFTSVQLLLSVISSFPSSVAVHVI